MGIKAKDVKAKNVVEGAQLIGLDPDQAKSVVRLVEGLASRGIEADSVEAENVVSGLQYIALKREVELDDLRKEIAALRSQVEEAARGGEIAEAENAADATAALAAAEEEAGKDEPNRGRLVRKLKEATEVLTESARTAAAAGKLGKLLATAAPLAAAVWQIASKTFGS